MRFFGYLLAALLFTGIFLPVIPFLASSAHAQDTSSVLLQRFVENPDGSLNKNTPPKAFFTAYLNANRDSILIENAPRWEDDLPNLQEGQGTFSLQVGNFPSLSAGDSVHIRFTDVSLNARGFMHVHIDTIPWSDPSPFARLSLKDTDLPARPAGLNLSLSGDGTHSLSWQTEAGLTYSVYRRTKQDTAPTGESRNLYTRVARGLQNGSYSEQPPNPDHNYAYIVYAQNDAGIYSAHSAEVTITRPVTGLTMVDSTATTVQLAWNPYPAAVGKVGGYQIYRRTENGTYGNPIGYTSPDTHYTDSRLEPGATYYYKVEARDQKQNFTGISDEVAVTTDADRSSYYQYATLRMAAIIYMQTNNGSITEKEVESIKKQYERTRDFYWRNSGFKLNVEMDYYIVRNKVNLNNDASVSNVAYQLRQRGVYNTQYDLVFAAWPVNSGFWSIGDGANLALPGPDRTTGFAQTQLPCGNGVGYPIEPGEERCATWTYMHENQHTIGAIYGRMGTPMMHGDFPQAFYHPAGMHLDFQASMFRVFDDYLNLKYGWGEIYEARDADGDRFPDHDSRAPYDELTFGSDPDKADTDSDGLNDRAEAMDGNYWGSDPTLADTDGDGVRDGKDDHPRYAIDSYIKKLPDTVDIRVNGSLDDWNALDARVSTGVDYVYNNKDYQPEVYMTYTADSLYIGMKLPDIGIPELRFEFEGDGRWHGAGNTRMSVNISDGTFESFRSWDAREEVRQFVDDNPDDQYPGNGMWDTHPDYQNEFRRRVFQPQSVHLSSNISWPKVEVELSIPRNPKAGLHLVSGDSIGWNIHYGKVLNKPENWSTTFDQHAFVYFDLIDEQAAATEKQEIARKLRLKQNYPNPFNPSTRITYSLPQSRGVSLKVYDLLGREVATLVDGNQKAGQHTVRFNADHLSSGIYFYRLRAGGETKIRKMTLVK